MNNKAALAPEFVIRRAVAGDVEAIVRLANAGGPEGKPRKALPDVLPDSYHQVFDKIEADVNQRLMVVESEGDIVGTFHLTFIYYLAGAGRPDLQVEAIHVAASQRRRGLGTKMLEWAIALARKHDCRRVQLTTDKRRGEAHALYLRLGFEFSHEGAKLVF